MERALAARTRIVQSPANRWVKALRAALAQPPALSAETPGLLALEGFHLLTEAVRSGLAPAAIFLRSGEEGDALRALEGGLKRIGVDLQLLSETELLVLPPALFATVVETETPRPITALVPAPAWPVEALLLDAGIAKAPLLLVLAGLQDPGNVGTLLRSAEAFGATGAILLPGTATPWSGKCLRASAGSALRLPMAAMRHAGEAGLLLRRHGVLSFAAVAGGGRTPSELPLQEASALWIGNEGAGLGERELALCHARVTLPMPGAVESLNAAVAGSLLLYEASRQRSMRQGGRA